MLTVHHVGYDALSVSSSEPPLRIGRKEVGLYEHAVLYVQDVHDLGQRKAQTLGPREHVLGDLFLPVVGVSLPFMLRTTRFLPGPLHIVVWGSLHSRPISRGCVFVRAFSDE